MLGVVLSVVALLVTVAVLAFALRLRTRHRAASNVLFAKYTFDQLKKNTQKQVHDTAVGLVKNSESKTRGFANDAERYGWYALAMREMGISSQVPENPNWYPVRNPYRAISPSDVLLSSLAAMLSQQYGIQIQLNGGIQS